MEPACDDEPQLEIEWTTVLAILTLIAVVVLTLLHVMESVEGKADPVATAIGALDERTSEVEATLSNLCTHFKTGCTTRYGR